MATFLRGESDRFVLRVPHSNFTQPTEVCAGKDGAVSFHEIVRDRGWAVLDLVVEDKDEAELLAKWHSIFREAFAQDEDEKVAGGKYRSVKKLPVGFRRDDEREFFETRIFKDEDGFSSVNPLYTTSQYERLVRLLFRLERHVARAILQTLLRAIGIHPDAVIDLTDLKDYTESEWVGAVDDNKIVDVSSSLLRVCSYPSLQADNESSRQLTDTDPTDKGVVFGSHTDTSVLTLGLCSTDPGLELYDRRLRQWVNVERLAMQNCTDQVGDEDARCVPVIVFVGEVLQVLTRAYYRATIHRVRAPLAGTRISCPFIIRGKWGRIINMRNGENLESDTEEQGGGGEDIGDLGSHYPHACGRETLKKYTPDLDGSDVSLVHKILDMKRAKCRKRNENAVADWVLAAELEVLEKTGE